LQGHIGLSINLNLCRYDFVFPWPVTIAVNSDVIGIFNFSLCFTVGKNDLHSAALSVLSNLCVCVCACACVRVCPHNGGQ
jgi:hypothetical protein